MNTLFSAPKSDQPCKSFGVLSTFATMLLLASAVVILSLALFGCNTDPAKNFIGNWKLDSMQSGDTTLPSETISSMGYDELYNLELKEDGSASVKIGGLAVIGTWEAKDASTATISYGKDNTEIKLDNGKLSMEIQGDSTILILVKS